MPATQNRWFELAAPWNDGRLRVAGFRGREALSELFQFELELQTVAGATVAFDELIGKPLVLRVNVPGSPPRLVTGIVRELRQSADTARSSSWTAIVAPRVWLLTQTRQSRVFQQLSVPDILETVFRGYEMVSELKRADYVERTVCVQYDESDFAFASRLMEEEGIYYSFVHTEEGDRIVLGDGTRGAPTLEPAELRWDEATGGARERGRIRQWTRVQRLAASNVSLVDFSFGRSASPFIADQAVNAAFQASDESHPLAVAQTSGIERIEYPARVILRSAQVGPDRQPRLGELNSEISSALTRAAKLRAQEITCRSIQFDGGGDVAAMAPGIVFAFAPPAAKVGEYFLTAVEHEGIAPTDDMADARYQNRFACIPRDPALPFRPAPTTARPNVRGTQTATVVGIDGSEVWTDFYGRVKVRFHWDRQTGVADQDRSAWIRVAQGWAGKDYGMISIPRVGQEVLVDFLDGDPDSPVVVGSLYNDRHPTPFPLPEHALQCGWKSKSNDGHASKNFSGMAIDDTRGKEHMQLQAERDMTVSTEKSHYTNVGDENWLTVSNANITMVGGLPFVDYSTAAPRSGGGAGRGPGRGSGRASMTRRAGSGEGRGPGETQAERYDRLERERNAANLDPVRARRQQFERDEAAIRERETTEEQTAQQADRAERVNGQPLPQAELDRRSQLRQFERQRAQAERQSGFDNELARIRNPFEWTASSLGGIATDLRVTAGVSNSVSIGLSNSIDMNVGMKAVFKPQSLLTELGIGDSAATTAPWKAFTVGMGMLPADFSYEVNSSSKYSAAQAIECKYGRTLTMKGDIFEKKKASATANKIFGALYFAMAAGVQLLPMIPRTVPGDRLVSSRLAVMNPALAVLKLVSTVWTAAHAAIYCSGQAKKAATDATDATAAFMADVALGPVALAILGDATQEVTINTVYAINQAGVPVAANVHRKGESEDIEGCKVVNASGYRIRSNPEAGESTPSLIALTALGKQGAGDDGHVHVSATGMTYVHSGAATLILKNSGSKGTLGSVLSKVEVSDSKVELSVLPMAASVELTSQSVKIKKQAMQIELGVAGLTIDSGGAPITLKADGNNQISITPAGVEIKSLNWGAQANINAQIAGAVVNVGN